MRQNFSSASLEQRFREAFSLLPQPIEHGVIGLSGGADSVVLTWLLAHHRHLLAPNATLEAVYVHHGISEHAQMWADFCAQYARSLGLDFTCERVHLDPNSKLGIEAEARRVRYQILQKHMGTGSVLFTAHHANDQAETFLLALKRGSGLPGLSCMSPLYPWAGGYIFRPLLEVSRRQIEGYAADHQLEFVTDESNSDTHYDRNFLRHEIIVPLEDRFQGFLDMVGYSAKFIAQAQELLNEVAQQDLTECKSSACSLSIAKLQLLSRRRQENVVRYFWHQLCGSYPSRSLLRSLWDEILPARIDSQPSFSENGFALRRYMDDLYVVCLSDLAIPQMDPLVLDRPFVIAGRTYVLESCSTGGFRIPPQWLNFDYSFSTVLHPKTRRHSRSVKKLFGELKIPVWLRALTPLVMVDQQVVGLFPNVVEEGCYSADLGYRFREITDKQS